MEGRTARSASFSVRRAAAGEDVAAFAALCHEYGRSLEYSSECASLEHQGFAAELAGLPGVYAEPRGAILLAWVGDTAAGCVAMRPLEPGVCEMKRMYVRPEYRGLGIGRALAEAALAAARERGYLAMRLDTGATMQAAAAMYRSLGFREISAYNRDPTPGTVWMELRL